MKSRADILEEVISKTHAQVERDGGELRSRQVRAALEAVAEQLAELYDHIRVLNSKGDPA